MANPTRKPRDPASKAVVMLRKFLGKTQQEFAVEILQTTVTTVSRYETKYPPKRETLLKLAAIADEQSKLASSSKLKTEYAHLQETFIELYLQEVKDRVSFQNMRKFVEKWGTSSAPH